MERSRVVDLLFENSYGSGYLLTNDLVLTAYHVRSLETALPEACHVRPLEDVNSKRRGRMIWGAPAQDVALVRLDADQAFQGFEELPLFGEVRSTDVSEFACRSLGFPRATRQDDGLREDYQLAGRMTLIARGGMFNITPTTAVPDKPELWRGYSGAAIYSADALVGIIATVPLNFAGGLVRATPILPLLQDPGFIEALAPAAVKRSVVRPVDFRTKLARQVEPFFCFMDRTNQVDEIQKLLASPGAALAGRGVYVTGVDKDEPHLLIQRLAQEPGITKLLRDADPERTITRIAWPAARVVADQDAAFKTLLAECATALCLPEEAEESEESFREAIAESGQAFGLWWILDLGAMGAGHAALLERWIAFCVALAAGPLPFLWFLCVLPDTGAPRPAPLEFLSQRFKAEEPDPAVVKVLGAHNDKSITYIGGLDPVTSGHVTPWLDEIGKLRPRWPKDERDELSRLLVGAWTGATELRLREFRELVAQVLKEAS
jgi:hypothetical protein